MGTDPSFFSTPKVDAREADYEQVEAEMKRLQKLIREATRTQGSITAADSLTGSQTRLGMPIVTHELIAQVIVFMQLLVYGAVIVSVFCCNFRHPA